MQRPALLPDVDGLFRDGVTDKEEALHEGRFFF